MGYRTYFTGEVEGPLELIDEFVEWAEKQNGSFGDYGADPLGFVGGEFGDDMSWYDHDTDTVKLSVMFPYLLFILSGEGEEAGDIWKMWARNGQAHKVQARIVLDEPDNLDTLLPSPDVAVALAELKAKKIAEIDAEIAKLQNKKDSL